MHTQLSSQSAALPPLPQLDAPGLATAITKGFMSLCGTSGKAPCTLSLYSLAQLQLLDKPLRAWAAALDGAVKAASPQAAASLTGEARCLCLACLVAGEG